MRRVVKILKKKHFYFLITVYPLLFLIAGKMEGLFYDYFNKGLYYGYTAAAISLLVAVFALLEIFKRVQGYELQGDKLRMRRREGVKIDEFD